MQAVHQSRTNSRSIKGHASYTHTRHHSSTTLDTSHYADRIAGPDALKRQVNRTESCTVSTPMKRKDLRGGYGPGTSTISNSFETIVITSIILEVENWTIGSKCQEYSEPSHTSATTSLLDIKELLLLPGGWEGLGSYATYADVLMR